MAFALKAEIADRRAERLVFPGHKTMYGGKAITRGDTVFVFAREAQGGEGLVARARVVSAEAVARPPDEARWTPRVSVTLARTALALRPLGRRELKAFNVWDDGAAGTELNVKLYRQATDKIVGISDAAASFLESFF